MLSFNINLTSLAVILWSGMLIIAGSIWVLSSQVRKLADLFEDHTKATTASNRPSSQGRGSASIALGRGSMRRGTSSRARVIARVSALGMRGQAP